MRFYTTGTLRYTSSGLGLLFFWLLWGDFCVNLMEAVIPNVIPLKLKSLGGSATLISLFMTSLPGVVLLVWNPVIATWSDRTRTRWGRRIPFLLAGTPAMALILTALGFCDPAGRWLASWMGGAFMTAAGSIVVLGLLVLMFHMCNSFVWFPYWSLFNDTVPREVMGRFSMLFRIVSTAAVAAFNFLVFPHAETHYRQIFVGAGIVFAIAYLLMCLNVKEGEYPAPRVIRRRDGGFGEKVGAYFRECFGHPFYWYLNLGAAFTVVGGAATPFILLMNKSLGLDLQQIGWINGGAALITLPAFFVAGFLIDRWNVVKIMFYGRLLQTLVTAGFLVFLFADLTPRQVLTVTVVLNLLLLIVTAILLVATLPMQMRLLPRERYGQFTSAMSVTVGVAGIVAGALMGGFIDGMRYVHHGSDFALRYAPLWLTCFYGAATYMQYRVHRHVQAVCGGNLSAFVPPDTSEISESSLARACEPLMQENK